MSEEGIVVVENTPETSILQIQDPGLKLEKATEVANILADVISKQKLFAKIKGKKYVIVEGWTTLGSMVGLYPYLDWVKKIPTEEGGITYQARIIAQTIDGLKVSSGEAICSDKEMMKTRDGRVFPRWEDEHEIMSMAQTRATGKAMRLPLGWIMALAGYETTPSEEMQRFANQKIAPKNTNSEYERKETTGNAQEVELNEEEEAIAWFNTLEHEIRNEKGDPKAKIKKSEIWVRAVNYKKEGIEIDGYKLTTKILGALKNYMQKLPTDEV
jgi:hypothetical protein